MQKSNQDDKNNKKTVSIATLVRVRPLIEDQLDYKQCIKCLDEKTLQISLSEVKRRQSIQRLLSPQCTQRQLYEKIEPIIEQVKEGYNVTVLTYGQTGSGKTYTMFGNDWNNIIKNYTSQKIKQSTFLRSIQQDQNQAGVIPRVINHIFSSTIQQRKKHIKVYCSFLQIYNEQMMDLLEEDKNSAKKLQIHENKTDGIYVEGLNEIEVADFDQCVAWMQKGQRNRVVRQTHMNIKSSRSHTIFQLLIQEVFPSTRSFRRMKINLCDLAGSQKINKNERMENQHFQELRNINLSLTTLGKVISSLSSKEINKPCYRDSKLTRLLQDSIGGNAYTAIIATITTKVNCIDQSLNTLKFLERAKQIKTEIVNRVFNENSQMRNLQKEITYLKDLLKMKRNGANLDIDNGQKMKKLQQQNQRLKQLIDKQLVDKLTKENIHLKRALQQRYNDDLSDSYLQHKTLQQNQDHNLRSQKQPSIAEKNSSKDFRTSKPSSLGKNFNKSYTNKADGSTATHKQGKSNVFPSINGRGTSRNVTLKIIDRIQQIQRMKKMNRARLQHDLGKIDQRQSIQSKKTFGRSSKYSSNPGQRV